MRQLETHDWCTARLLGDIAKVKQAEQKGFFVNSSAEVILIVFPLQQAFVVCRKPAVALVVYYRNAPPPEQRITSGLRVSYPRWCTREKKHIIYAQFFFIYIFCF